MVQSNEMTTAIYNLPIVQQRILQLGLSQYGNKPITKGDDLIVTSQEYAELTITELRNARKSLRTHATSLLKQDVLFRKYHDGTPMIDRHMRINIFDRCVYLNDESAVMLKFSASILPWVSELTEKFTAYWLMDTRGFVSIYGIRLYQIMMQWLDPKKNRGGKQVMIDEIRTLFDLHDVYPRVSQIKERVLGIALRDINTLSPFVLTTVLGSSGMAQLPEIKKGKKVVGFQIEFKRRKKETAV